MARQSSYVQAEALVDTLGGRLTKKKFGRFDSTSVEEKLQALVDPLSKSLPEDKVETLPGTLAEVTGYKG